MKTSIPFKNSRLRRSRHGFSLMELLMAVGVISCVAAVGIFVMTGATQSARAGKLESDVATLNNAVRIYLTHGGTISKTASPQGVIDQLKSVADSSSRKRLAGLRSSMVDARLRGTPATASDTRRAVWNPDKLRFELANAGYGFSSFDLEGTPAAVETQEQRSGAMQLAKNDKWIWDSADAGASRDTPTQPITTVMAVSELPDPAVITRLAAPDVSMPGALYDFSAYNPNLNVTLVDRNVPGVSQLVYSIDNGPWKVYTGTPLSIPPVFLSTLRTYAVALNDQSYEDSDILTEKYETIYFTGATTGNFYSPAGDRNLVSNLLGLLKLPHFAWGTPVGLTRQNELDFTGSSFTRIAPDEEFSVGTLSYYNGTTGTGTNATSVKIGIELNLSEPAVKETLTFTFNLLSTPNRGKSADEDADYVYIPSVSTNFSTVIKGKTFALVLRFGEHSADGFTTIDTFHAHEGKTLTGTIYGRLTEVKGAL